MTGYNHLMTDLTSRQNTKIKLVRALGKRKARLENKLFLVEGLRHLGELADSSFNTEYILYAPETLTSDFGIGLLEMFRSKNIEVLSTTGAILDSLSSKSSSAGILAVVQQTNHTPETTLPSPGRPTVALVSPQDPGNIGTILRTMDAVQAGALYLLDGGTDPWHLTTVRASMGAIFWHPIIQCSFDAFAAWSRKNNVHVYGTSAKGSDSQSTLKDYAQPGALLLGSEREGLTPKQTAVCDHLVRLPMKGRGSSLNLAVAAGVMLYMMSGKK